MNNIALNKLSLIAFTLAFIWASYFFIGKAFILLLPFLIGWIFSTILSPIVEYLNKKLHIHSGFVSILGIVVLVAISGFIVFLISKGLIDLVNKFVDAYPSIIEDLNEYSVVVQSKLDSLNLPFALNISEIFYKSLASLVSYLGNYGGTIAANALGFVASLPNVLIFVIVTIISTFFMTKDREKIKSFIKNSIKVQDKPHPTYIFVKEKIFKIIWGYLRAQLIMMSITFVICSIGLIILGKKYAIITALGIALFDAVPALGPAMIFVPWSLTMFIVGKTSYAASLMILYLVCTITRQLLEPKIVSTQIGVYPLLTLMSLYIGVKTLGVIGILVGPFTIIILQTLYENGLIFKRNRTL